MNPDNLATTWRTCRDDNGHPSVGIIEDARGKSVRAQFPDGSVYDYFDVPQSTLDLITAYPRSRGCIFNRKVRFGGYRWQKIKGR
jgi:hypothetical protein